MEWMKQIVANSDIPLLTSFVLGLIMATSPCPLATNITATAYLSKDIGDNHRVFINGLLYTLGHIFSYTALGLIFFLGASQFEIARFLHNLSGIWLGIALVAAGILMLDVIKINFPSLSFASKMNGRKITYRNAFLMGVVFALAFCPYSGVIYFGMLIPITIASPSGLLLPPVFAIAAALPVIIASWLIAYSISNVGKFYNSMKSFEKWFKHIVAAVFIIVGIYFIVINF